MMTPYEPPIEPLSGNWNEDKAKIFKLAQTPTSAQEFPTLVQSVHALFRALAPAAVSPLGIEQRVGLSRKIHNELYPLGNFAELHFAASAEVQITWHDGSQSFDATVEDRRAELEFSSKFLEITTLQDKEDADQLDALNPTGIVSFSSSEHPVLADHRRKVGLLRSVLEKKAKITYPAGTALLVYTDEFRFKSFTVGAPAPVIDQPHDYGEVLDEMKSSLGGFDAVYVFSKQAIYCTLSGGEVFVEREEPDPA